VAGAVKWRKHQLPEPPEITAATDSYRDEQDTLAPFLHERLVIAHGKDADDAQVSETYKRYIEWCEENGEKPVSRKRLSAMLKEHGFENYQATDGKFYWRGVALK
jgi:putative DNA primase/helicase